MNVVTPDMLTEDLVIVEVTRGPDSFDRSHFSAYWLASNVGPRGNEHGVRGQLFTMSLETFTGRCEAVGKAVITMEEALEAQRAGIATCDLCGSSEDHQHDASEYLGEPEDDEES